MPSPERKRGGAALAGYRKFNEITLAAELGVAVVGVFAAPVVVAPALTLAAIDGAQIIVIDRWQKGGKNKKTTMKEAAYGKHMSSVSKEHKPSPIIQLFSSRPQKTEYFRDAA